MPSAFPQTDFFSPFLLLDTYADELIQLFNEDPSVQSLIHHEHTQKN